MPIPETRRPTLTDATTIIIGLGNPGPRFADTRHNVGWKVLDLLAHQIGVPVNERRPKAILGTGYHDGRRVALAKPRTFMNNSGEAVAYLLARFGGNGSNLLIVYDEMALLPGRIRLRAAGSDAGHNGIRSIIQAVGGTGFPRLRIGIGGPPPGVLPHDHVLGKFSSEESEAIEGAVARAAAAVQCLLSDGIDAAMNRYNQDPAAVSAAPQPERAAPGGAGPDGRGAAADSPRQSQGGQEQDSASGQQGQ